MELLTSEEIIKKDFIFFGVNIDIENWTEHL